MHIYIFSIFIVLFFSVLSGFLAININLFTLHFYLKAVWPNRMNKFGMIKVIQNNLEEIKLRKFWSLTLVLNNSF